MSDVLESAATTLREKLGGTSFDGSVKFEIEDEGSVRIEGDEVSIDDSEADCTIKADAETFKSMVTGDLNPTAAFMSGKLTVEGDMSKAMALSSVLA
jgi:putative sterol carrier protein